MNAHLAIMDQNVEVPTRLFEGIFVKMLGLSERTPILVGAGPLGESIGALVLHVEGHGQAVGIFIYSFAFDVAPFA